MANNVGITRKRENPRKRRERAPAEEDLAAEWSRYKRRKGLGDA